MLSFVLQPLHNQTTIEMRHNKLNNLSKYRNSHIKYFITRTPATEISSLRLKITKNRLQRTTNYSLNNTVTIRPEMYNKSLKIQQ